MTIEDRVDMGDGNRRWRADIGRMAITVSLIGTLVGCGSRDEPPGGYPSLRSVPQAARTSTPVDERRDIVRGLIEERDRSRRQTSKVRARSGLDASRLPSGSDDVRAEDVIPDTAADGDERFRLTPKEGGRAGSVYRGESQFEDGSLDDFIRKLKRETLPSGPSEGDAGQADRPVSDDGLEADIDARLLDVAPLMMVAAVAPVTRAGSEKEVLIRLAAAEEEPGFFCSYLGWTVAWSSMCVDETAPPPAAEGDQGVGADLGEEAEQAEDEEASPGRRSARSRSSTADETGEERAERRLSEEDAAEAIENAGRSALAPVTSSLDKLRDFIETRRSRNGTSSREERTPALRRESAEPTAAAIDRPPLPRSRPERRLDVHIEDGGERFDFIRTPRPHFKPAREDVVILPPEKARPTVDDGSRKPHLPHLKPIVDPDVAAISPPDEGRRTLASLPRNPTPEPSPGPDDLTVEREALVRAEARAAQQRLDAALATLKEGIADIETVDRPAETPAAAAPMPQPVPKMPAAASSEGPEPLEAPSSLAAIEPAGPPPEAEATDHATIIITFEPETPGLPEGIGPRLAAILTHAKSTDHKIHIVGEASTNHLARRRATDVGAALVQLGATVEILEYDHLARTGVDQVRLVLLPEGLDPEVSAMEPAPTEK